MKQSYTDGRTFAVDAMVLNIQHEDGRIDIPADRIDIAASSLYTHQLTLSERPRQVSDIR